MSSDKHIYSDRARPGATDEKSISFGEPRLVTVKMFDREYQIKTDQPQLVELLAAEVNREARKLRDSSPAQMGPGHFDWPVQVAFQLALSRFRTQEEYNTLKAQIDSEAERMAERITATLDQAEAEKMVQRIKADLDDNL
ncbi:MAG: cell division protein ZapA [Candidatus Adiutrix sp.]|jgi:cell division protein ZapA (FtsZ GTPase activity inhibitor)|nr:cell division protein ZapA [Candidatus Adiutrix sp.]